MSEAQLNLEGKGFRTLGSGGTYKTVMTEVNDLIVQTYKTREEAEEGHAHYQAQVEKGIRPALFRRIALRSWNDDLQNFLNGPFSKWKFRFEAEKKKEYPDPYEGYRNAKKLQKDFSTILKQAGLQVEVEYKLTRSEEFKDVAEEEHCLVSRRRRLCLSYLRTLPVEDLVSEYYEDDVVRQVIREKREERKGTKTNTKE